MERVITYVIRFIPMWLVILAFYTVGGLVVGLVGCTIAMLSGGTLSFVMSAIVGSIAGGLLGIWAVIER
jgi:hypothetical protein